MTEDLELQRMREWNEAAYDDAWAFAREIAGRFLVILAPAAVVFGVIVGVVLWR